VAVITSRNGSATAPPGWRCQPAVITHSSFRNNLLLLFSQKACWSPIASACYGFLTRLASHRRKGVEKVIVKRFITCTLAFLAPLTVEPNAGIPIAAVPAAFAASRGSGLPETVSLSGFYFEVNKETGRARIVIDYVYGGQQAVESEDRHRPDPSYVQPPGLTYDPATRTIVYTHDGKRTICATVSGGRRAKVKNSGNCFVTAAYADHVKDNGWAIGKNRVLETYLETR